MATQIVLTSPHPSPYQTPAPPPLPPLSPPCAPPLSVIMFLISWFFTLICLLLAVLIYYYVSIKGKAGDWGDGVKSAYLQLALRSLKYLGSE